MSGLGVSYLPPTENVAIFDSSLYQQNTEPLTYQQAIQEFLAYPQAQGTETLQNTNVAGTLKCSSSVVLANGIDTNAGDNYITYSGSGTAGVYSLGIIAFNSLTSFTNNSLTGVNLPLSISSLYYNTPIYLQNATTNSLTITSQNGNFQGYYSVGSSTNFNLTAGLTIGIFWDTGLTTAGWNIFQTSSGSGGSQTLSQVLTTGNSAGTTNINMNQQQVQNVSAISGGTSGLAITAPSGQGITIGTSGTPNNLNVNGIIDFNNNDNLQTFDDANGLHNIIFTNKTNPIATASINNTLTGSQNTILGAGNCGQLLGTAVAGYNNIAIGANALAGTTAVSTDAPSYNIAIGVGSLQSLQGGGTNNLTNCGIGLAALGNLQNGQNNVGIGYASGYNSTTGGNNSIYIGSQTGNSGVSNVNNSLVLGSFSLAGASNQVVIGANITGSSTSNTIILGDNTYTTNVAGGLNTGAINAGSNSITTTGTVNAGTLTFANSSLSSGISYSTYQNTGAGFTLPSSAFNSLTSITSAYAGAFTITLPTISSIYYGLPLFIQNNSGYTATVSSPAGNFVGRYKSGSSSEELDSGATLGFFYDQTLSGWNCFYKELGNTISISNNTNNNLNPNIANSTIRLNPTGTGCILTFPTLLSTSGSLLNSWVELINETSNSVGLSSTTSLFSGAFGNQSTSTTILPYSTIRIYCNSTALNYEVVDRVVANATYTATYSGTTITLTYVNIDSNINLSGSTATQINLPNPTTTSNAWISGRYLNIYNNGSANLTLLTPVGTLNGVFGSGASTIILPPNSWYYLTSDGSNWSINERSPHITYSVTLTANNTPAVSVNNYLNSTIYYTNNTASYTSTIETPSATNANTQMYLINSSSYTITLSIGSGTFAGLYGTGTTTYSLLPNTFANMNSIGSTWNVFDRTPNQYGALTITTNTTITQNQLNQYLALTSTSPYTLLLPTASIASGQYVDFENKNTNSGLLFTLSTTSSFTGTYGSGGGTSLIIPPQSRIKLYSNGTSWVGTEISNYGWSYPTITASATPSISYTQYYRNYVNYVGSTTDNWTLTSNPPSAWEGLIMTFRGINSTSNSTTYKLVGSASYSAPNTSVVAIMPALQNNESFYSTTTLYTYTFEPLLLSVVKTGYIIGAGTGGTATGTSGSRTLTIAGISSSTGGSLGIGSSVLISGATYTITGMGTATSGTATYVANATTISIVSVSGNDALLQGGTAIVVSGVEFLLTSLVSGTGGGSSVFNIAITSATGFTSTAFTPPTGIGFAGSYTISPALSATYSSTAMTITGEAYNWAVIS